MAHVLNRSERNYAFWKFLFFFLLSTALIVGAVYFDILIPAKDTEKLREQVLRYKSQEAALENFAKTMDDTRQLIDSLNKPVTDLGFLKGDIDTKIRELNNLEYTDSSIYRRLNKNFIDVITLYKNTTLMNINLKGELQTCTNSNDKCRQDLTDANKQLDEYRSKAPGTGFGPN